MHTNKIKSLLVSISHSRNNNDPCAVCSAADYAAYRQALEWSYSDMILAVYPDAVINIYHDTDAYQPLEISNVEMDDTDIEEVYELTDDELDDIDDMEEQVEEWHTRETAREIAAEKLENELVAAREDATAIISRLIVETFVEVAEAFVREPGNRMRQIEIQKKSETSQTEGYPVRENFWVYC